MGIVARDFGVRAGDVWLFRELDLDVPAGECLALIGENGSGKSTILRCLYGMQVPLEGRLSVADRKPDELDVAFRRDVAVLFDDSDLFVELTPVQHLELLAGTFGIDLDIGELLRDAGLDERSDVTAGSLSAGQRRRLMLLGATARPYRVLLLDEPERALDAGGKEWLTEVVGRAKDAGAAVVVATHHPPLLEVAESVVDLSGQL